jgi:outer membrane protein assembly factor BamB
MGIPEQGGALQWEVFDEQAERALDFHHPVARHLRAVIKAARGRSRFRRRERHARLTGGMALEWSEPFEEDITAIAVGDAILCGTSSGRVIRKDADSGATLWENRLDHAVSAVCLMDGTPWSGEYGNTPAGSVAVGTTQSTLSVLDGRNGNALWTRALKNISGRGEKVVDIAVADLYGDGRRHLLAATAGWYVNAYTLEGEPLWDTWIRYHVITRLNVLDADGDGKAEVMVGNIYSTPLTVHNADGSFRWSTLEQVGAEGNATTPRRGIRLTEMVVQDINEDGVREIIYGTADGWLYAVSPVDGRECWRLNVVGEVTGLSAAGEHFYVSTEFGRMYGIDRYGAIVWSRTVSDQINGLALCGAHLVASDDTGLYRCDRSGNPSGSLTTPASVTGMVASGDRLYGVLGGTQLCRIHLMNFDDDIR